MPLFYQENINEATKLGVWQITEQEEYFKEAVPLKAEIHHPHKRLQHLAARYLLQYLRPDFPYHLIEIADSRKPYIPSEEYHFSVSHCGNYAAAIVSRDEQVGLDIELYADKIHLIKHKFLSAEEMGNIGKEGQEGYIKSLSVLWSAKEAMYKWHGLGAVDFKQHMKCLLSSIVEETGTIASSFEKEKSIALDVQYRLFPVFCLAWVKG
jgi:phosphopantetheinyl transferase